MSDNKEFTSADFLLNELNEMKKGFANVPKKILQKIVNTELKEEKKAILELYEEEIASLPRNDPIKLEILNVMLYLDINPFDNINIKEIIDMEG